MKLFIIEGPDNTGKTHLANAIIRHLNNNGKESIKYIHFVAPKGNTPAECCRNEYDYSEKVAKDIRKDAQSGKYTTIVLDRSWYSEYVYGQLYRERRGVDILRCIRNFEDIIINSLNPEDCYYIYTTADKAFLAAHEDGKSLSKANSELLDKEITLFDEMFDNVMLGNVIKLNVADNDNKHYVDDKLLIAKIFDTTGK